ncbi:hypothetical protein ABB37_02074 [Leptomonas pyrrhocoris]|uniref:Calponin-homology (CH) domain-containing protein n=1 Tax=Leptomonas pyrrhocoris TaxID=157538 RepID=A0A0M9G756_LEPPY|nr:hypothetical protein ABB37_02074 [Leptomonas pyrrhocoris]KPA83887.1 hypothetical protein ABB37_02074 [Leptomonas pyrrhocoris]|eukprot:XP_015662326.1 hypothetical protein ABB37_02074 [Leptomonas pyrrhocoris]
MALRSAALSGRKELLAWLNNLCNSTYPSVESLRDGAAYCTIVEAAISRIAQNSAATHSSEAPIANSRAEQARVYLNKVDWSATAVVCEGTDPSLDSMSVRTACAHNMQLLQDILHDCVPAAHRYTAEASRLAAGKLQDHVLLLRWMYSFMSKVLAHYSRKALEKKGEVVAGTVEGVKLNRTALLRSSQVNGVVERGGHEPAQTRERGEAGQGLASHAHHMSATRVSAGRSLSGSPSPALQSVRASGEEESRSPDDDAYEERQLPRKHAHRVDKEEPSATPRSSSVGGPPTGTAANAEEETPRGKTVHSHYTRGTIAVPEHLRGPLVSLRNEVEEVEEIVLYVQEQHNFYLTHPANGTRTYTPSAAVRNVDSGSQYRLDARETVSLEELGRLLEERDALAQQYAATDAIVTRALQQAEAQGKAASPLLRDIVDLLRPH